MTLQIRKPKDFITGALFLVVGVGAFVMLREYQFGEARKMGPGYVPSVLSGLLVMFAVILIARSLVGAREAIEKIPLRAPLLVVAGALLFALLIRPAGLVVAIMPMVLTGMFSISRSSIPVALLTAAILAGGSALVFVYALEQPIPVLGYWFGG